MTNHISNGVKKNLSTIITVIIVFALVGAGIYWVIKNPSKTEDKPVASGSATPNTAATVKGQEPGTAPNSATAPDTSLPAQTSGATAQQIAEIPKYQYTQTYASKDYGFTFKYPKDFTTSEIPNDTGTAILVENIPQHIGAQIVISKFDGPDQDLTKADIAAQIPDLKITGEQEVLIGANRKGLAFMSDSPAFGGQSREVWFVYKGNLYQISTYAELDQFLKGLFGTWQFK
jgi:hypothetical protein